MVALECGCHKSKENYSMALGGGIRSACSSSQRSGACSPESSELLTEAEGSAEQGGRSH